MLFISVKKIPSIVISNGALTVYATIIDYSKKGLKPESQKLFWRMKGEQNWKTEALKSTEKNIHYFVTIPAKKSDFPIEYYISSSSKSGKTETMPRTAPFGFYSVER